MEKGKIYIGTSGWHYMHWKGPFYPKDLPVSHFLETYIKSFHTVEINNSFYRLPEVETLYKWAKAVPNEFLFSIKASRFITHIKRLKDPVPSVKKFTTLMKHLGPHLGPILFQLPPHWKVDEKRLKGFLSILPKDFRYTFEFRDQSWIKKSIFDLLRQYKVAFCFYDLEGYVTPMEITANFVYLRLHGPKEPYEGSYSSQALAKWAQEIKKWSLEGKDVYCYFNNDDSGFAPKNALKLIENCI